MKWKKLETFVYVHNTLFFLIPTASLVDMSLFGRNLRSSILVYIVALFEVECNAWFWVGEIVGRGFIFHWLLCLKTIIWLEELEGVDLSITPHLDVLTHSGFTCPFLYFCKKKKGISKFARIHSPYTWILPFPFVWSNSKWLIYMNILVLHLSHWMLLFN